MKINYVIICLLILRTTLVAQEIRVESVFPSQNYTGAARNSNISLKINKSIDSVSFQAEKLFSIKGSNSGIILGTVYVDSANWEFRYSPEEPFFSGEIINISFGPLITTNGDTLFSFNWRFSVEITHPTNAKFDSLKRFTFSSFNSIPIDYDKDGDVDLASGTGKVIYNNGYGEFTTIKEIEPLTNVKYLVDLNNDNNIDIVSSGSGNVKTFFGNDSGSYSLKETLYPFNQEGGVIIAQGDLNGDHFIDLIATEIYNESNNLWKCFINDRTGIFRRDTNATYLKNWITDAELVDMDNDGDLDLVLLNTYGPASQSNDFFGAYVYYNEGKGSFPHHSQLKFNISPYDISISDLSQLIVADFDNNGLNDLAGFGAAEGGVVILQESLGVFSGYENTFFSGAENLGFLTSGDINGDNRFDIIVSNYQTCQECGDEGEVTFEATINCKDSFFLCDTISGGQFDLGLRKDVGVSVVPVVADVDNDGDLDIIHTGNPTTVTYNNNVISSIEQRSSVPSNFFVFQNYPNPFNNSTAINYYLPKSGLVEISIFDILGRLVETIIKGYEPQGNHSVYFEPSKLSSGLYFYKLDFNGKSIVKKMIFLK